MTVEDSDFDETEEMIDDFEVDETETLSFKGHLNARRRLEEFQENKKVERLMRNEIDSWYDDLYDPSFDISYDNMHEDLY